MTEAIEKVTAFITRQTERGIDLLLFKHPYADNQLPAGTVDEGETPEGAVLREAFEETGLQPLTIREYLGVKENPLPSGTAVVLEKTRVFARPDLSSFEWAYLRRGIQVEILRKAGGFSQVTYQEPDNLQDPQYVTMQITGWVPDQNLTRRSRHHFFHLDFLGHTPESWSVFTDNHTFTLFWASLEECSNIISPYQRDWLDFFSMRR
jgi:ADP-ribose pyrophosphatase YjhB (NUDIX family)